ncbi:MAG TPA: peroxiredoxin [Thermoprotei archaeon]|nr:peroxiredoxin [Thermoprotei archaeon]
MKTVEKEVEIVKEGFKFPLLGEKFPSLEVNTTKGKVKIPDDYKGKWLVLFSHPADFTPVCTTEFVAFQKRYEKFKELNCELIGLSIDQVFSHIKWVEWIKDKLGVEIQFPIIADDTGCVASQLGMIHPGKGTNTVRAVFIIDPNGVTRAILYYPQELGRNVDEILRMVKGLQVSDKNDVALPHNWPNNELIGDKVIIPPASDEKTAKERLERAKKGEIECYDWWFCYKKL